MIIGVPKEVKDNEYRVSMTPAGVELLVRSGHRVLVQQGAGGGSGFADEDYARSGAEIKPQAADVWEPAEMVIKVKEPLPQEYGFLREGLLLFTYLHLAAERVLTDVLAARKVTAIAYETVQRADGSLPLLTPMSQIAGRMAPQVASHYLERTAGGLGKLMGGVPGVRPANVVVIGGGTVGANAAHIALGMGAQVTVIDINAERLRYLGEVLHGNLITLSSNPSTVAEAVAEADAVIGAALVPGAKAPNLVTRAMVETMKAGSVIVDVAIDQGGCVETSRPTSHSNPTYLVNGVVHYSVPNIPGVVPWTSTYALSNATLVYAQRLADLGFEKAVRSDPALAMGVNLYRGHLTCKAVAEAFGKDYTPLATLL
jgi:alanine dehydrogenase